MARSRISVINSAVGRSATARRPDRRSMRTASRIRSRHETPAPRPGRRGAAGRTELRRGGDRDRAVPRLVTVVGEVEQIVARVSLLMSDIDRTQQRAAQVVERTEQLTERLSPLLDRFQPTLEQLEPIVSTLPAPPARPRSKPWCSWSTSSRRSSRRWTATSCRSSTPWTWSLRTSRDLLDVSKELNDILGAVPGLGRVKRKIEKEQDLEDVAPRRHREDGGAPTA